MDKQPKKSKEEQTPIIDGDTRPDQPIDIKDPKTQKHKKNAVTENRKGDTNSLEDYKDAL